MKFIDLFCGIGGFRIGFERNPQNKRFTIFSFILISLFD